MRMIPRSPLCLAATLLALLPLQPTRADQGDVTITLSPEAPHARSHVWQISYAWPDQTTCAKIELSYKYWDASEDGDVPAKKLLNSSPMKNNGSFLSFSVHLTKEQSLLVLGNNNLGIVGVAPAARLQIYKACQPTQPQSLEAQCNSFTLALALEAAIEAHAQIVNLSLGGPADPLLAQLISFGQHRGMIFVGAVPEDGRLDGFPLGIPGVIAVDESGRPGASSAVLYAPGRDIISLAPAGRYDFASGSSFAAAHVTGAIALLRARAPGLDAAGLFSVLERTRTHDEHGDCINVCAALAALQPKYECTQPVRAVASATATATVH